MTFGERLKSMRCDRHLSQRALADSAGISIRSIQNYEMNKRYPNSLDIIIKLASVLNTTSEYLLTGVQNRVFIEENGKYADALKLADQLCELFLKDELSDSERDAAMQKISAAYWTAKNYKSNSK